MEEMGKPDKTRGDRQENKKGYTYRSISAAV